MDDRAFEVRSPAEVKVFFLKPLFHTGSEPTQPPVQWVPWVLFLGLNRGWDVTLTTHPI
jgi:hypothetical protein